MADVFQAQWNWYKFPNLNFIAWAVNFYLLYLSRTDTENYHSEDFNTIYPWVIIIENTYSNLKETKIIANVLEFEKQRHWLERITKYLHEDRRNGEVADNFGCVYRPH